MHSTQKNSKKAYKEVQGTESEITECGRTSPISWYLQIQSKYHLAMLWARILAVLGVKTVVQHKKEVSLTKQSSKIEEVA